MSDRERLTRKRRRDRGEDSIYQRASDHRWIVEIRDGYKPSGRPNITYLTAKGYPDDTRENRKLNTEAKTKLLARRDEAKSKLRKGIPASDDVVTVASYLRRWLEYNVKPSKRPKTYESYESICRVHIIPILGRKHLAKLTPLDVQEMMGRILADGASPTTVKNVRGILRKALNDAMRDDLIGRNVVTLTDMPAQRTFHAKPLTQEEIPRFLAAARDHRLEALWSTFLMAGLRAGEAFGLRWQDIDLERGELRVRYQLQRLGSPKRAVFVDPKTEHSRRPIPLPSQLIETLWAHRARQQEEIIIAGSRWQGAEWQDLVFCTTTGTPLDQSNVIKQFRQVLDIAGLDTDRRVHDLRHTCATMLARLGVHPRQAQEILRHAQISTTLAIYTHVGADSVRSAVDQLGAMMVAGKVPE
jgi:integrase